MPCMRTGVYSLGHYKDWKECESDLDVCNTNYDSCNNELIQYEQVCKIGSVDLFHNFVAYAKDNMLEALDINHYNALNENIGEEISITQG